MTSMIGILSLLSALPVTSYALSCTQCTSKNSTCSGHSVACPSGYVCGSGYTEASAGGLSTVTLVRTCMSLPECNFEGSVSILQGQMSTATSCCYTDNCTPTIPALPVHMSYPNGVVCPSCMSTDSLWCYTSDNMQCTGDENMCLFQTKKISGSVSSSSALRGCSTKSMCNLGSLSQNVGGVSTEINFICSNGGIRVHKVVLTPAIVCLLLLKWFF